MATVANLDWPASGNLSVSVQKADLIEKLDELKAAGINLVFFQVRTEGDALYDSEIEPWSRYLTGTEGEAPDPYWDPLEFAVEEAHKRGMELHAWLNPYRAMRSVPSDFTQKQAFSENQQIDEHLRSFLAKEYNPDEPRYKRDTDQRDEKHVANTHPEWLLVVGNYAIFNPGLPEVMDYTVDIVMDIVNRYDLDGIHFDDYFYPYPPDQMTSSNPEYNALDDVTFEEYPRGFDNKADWRRNNVNMLIEMIYDSINVLKPWVEFGISPFGIWESGTPPGISGMSAYSNIYADGLAWLRSQTIDYINPQLYWKILGPQDFIKLSNWWADSAAHYNRHMYAGHGLYKASSNTFSGSTFTANEIPKQIRHTRSNPDIGGGIFFRTRNITSYSTKGFADSLKNRYYKFAALPPVMNWKDSTKPVTPQNLIVDQDEETEYIFNLTWNEVEFTGQPVAGSTHLDTLIKYAVYRVDSATEPNAADAMMNGENLIAITGTSSFTDIAPPSENEYYYFVTSANRNSIESEPSEIINAGIVVSNEKTPAVAEQFQLSQNYPNPFNPATEISFILNESGFTTLKVYDMLGREVRTLVNEVLTAGSHNLNFNASELSSGIYIYKLSMGDNSVTKKMTLIK